MRLHRIRLENWRGVTERDVDFGPGVTLVEGPNEIGKSSLVEALHTLIREYDSSAKQSIKAVQPAGRDVGSSVEADISTGDYRFTYRKTFNKNRQTELDITAPAAEQLSGREAHERVERMLAETIDPDLWEALLVDQGEKVAQASLAGSAGLSAALDEAAGGGGNDGDDGALFVAVEAEYDKYFTPTGKPRFGKEEQAVETAETRLVEARTMLAEVEEDAARYERLGAEVSRRAAELPELVRVAKDYEKQWRAIDATRNELGLKKRDLEAATAAQERAAALLRERQQLINDVAAAMENIGRQEKKLEPHQRQLDAIGGKLREAEAAVVQLKDQRRAVKARVDLAVADARHLRELAELGRLDTLLEELAEVTGRIESSAGLVAGIRIDQEGLDKLQDLENDIRVLEQRRDHAATRIVIRSEKAQELLVGNETVTLESGDTLERQIASETDIRLPGLASVLVDPPAAVTDLESELAAARDSFAALLRDYGTGDRDDARRQLATKTGAAADLQAAKNRERELLGGKNRAELDQARVNLAASIAAYEKDRDAEQPLPETIEAADTLAEAARADAEATESRLAEAESAVAGLQAKLREAERAARESSDELVGQRATLEDKKARLAVQRETRDDDALKADQDGAAERVEQAGRAVAEAASRLDDLNPERIETLRDNARDAADRAASELADLKTSLAVIEDRLQHSQANGRFESADEAERALEEARDRFLSVRRRAEAADLLWTTLNKHRTAARQSYVRPLKDAVEKLGSIVFGNDFAVTINDDWSIASRTQNGVTLPFEALSIGVQEQLGVLMRLAAAQIVAKQGGVPLIIDDALGFSDPTRLQSMGAAISAAGRHCQVIILTCVPGRFSSIGNAEVRRF